MKKDHGVWLLVMMTLLFPSAGSAEVITLTSGQKVEGKIVEKNDRYLKVDFQGVSITYYNDEVASIDGQTLAPSVTPEAAKPVSPLGADQEKMIGEILELSGLKKQIDSYPQMIQLQLAEYKNKQSPEVFEIVSNAMVQAYQPERIYKAVFDNLKANFNQERFARLLTWFRSPLSRKMSRLEEQASTSEGLLGMREMAARMSDAPPPQARLDLMQELDEVLGATDTSIETVVITNLQTLKAFQAALPADKRNMEAGWEEKMQYEVRRHMADPMQQTTILGFLYIYREVPEAEMREYISYWRSEEGMWANKIIVRALLEAMASVGREMGTNMANAMPAKLGAH